MSIRQLVGLTGLLPALVFYSAGVQAASWQQMWSAKVATEYESNPAMIPTFQQDIWRSILEPSYKASGTEGPDELDAAASVQIARSSNKVLSPNRQDARGSIDWRRHSETGEWGLSGGYQEIGTRLLGINNVLGAPDNTQASSSLSGRLNQSLNEQATFGVDGSYEHVSYRGGTFVDYTARSAGMKLGYAWSEYSTPFLRMSYATYEPANGNPASHLSSALLGWEWAISEELNLSVQAGKSRVNDEPMNKQGMAALQYSGSRTVLALNASRQVLASGLGGFIRVDQAQGNWDYALSERSKTGIDLQWQKNFLAIKILNYSAGAWLQYDTNSYWRARMYFQHKISQQEGVGRAYSNLLGLAVTFTPADF